jgi:hypothetical protein
MASQIELLLDTDRSISSDLPAPETKVKLTLVKTEMTLDLAFAFLSQPEVLASLRSIDKSELGALLLTLDRLHPEDESRQTHLAPLFGENKSQAIRALTYLAELGIVNKYVTISTLITTLNHHMELDPVSETLTNVSENTAAD